MLLGGNGVAWPGSGYWDHSWAVRLERTVLWGSERWGGGEAGLTMPHLGCLWLDYILSISSQLCVE